MVLDQEIPVVVSFWNPTKPATMDLNTRLEAMMEAYKGQVKFVKIDTYRNLRISRKCDVKDIPTVVFYNKGAMVDRIDVNVEVEAVEAKVKALLS